MSDVVYFDSCAFLAWLKSEPGRVDVIAQIFDEANNGRLKIVTSTLAIAEVLNIQGYKSPIPVEHREAVRSLFRNEWIIPKGVNRRIAEISQELVWAYGVKPKDGIHVATAMVFNVRQVYTYDGGLNDKKNLKTDYGSVDISEPLTPAQMKMDV